MLYRSIHWIIILDKAFVHSLTNALQLFLWLVSLSDMAQDLTYQVDMQLYQEHHLAFSNTTVTM